MSTYFERRRGSNGTCMTYSSFRLLYFIYLRFFFLFFLLFFFRVGLLKTIFCLFVWFFFVFILFVLFLFFFFRGGSFRGRRGLFVLFLSVHKILLSSQRRSNDLKGTTKLSIRYTHLLAYY